MFQAIRIEVNQEISSLKKLLEDASDLLNNPEIILNHWCNHLNILFDKKMLHWNEGFYSTDGIWGEHWYNNIIKTTNDNDLFKLLKFHLELLA